VGDAAALVNTIFWPVDFFPEIHPAQPPQGQGDKPIREKLLRKK
jgi:hypothetical protein